MAKKGGTQRVAQESGVCRSKQKRAEAARPSSVPSKEHHGKRRALKAELDNDTHGYGIEAASTKHGTSNGRPTTHKDKRAKQAAEKKAVCLRKGQAARKDAFRASGLDTEKGSDTVASPRPYHMADAAQLRAIAAARCLHLHDEEGEQSTPQALATVDPEILSLSPSEAAGERMPAWQPAYTEASQPNMSQQSQAAQDNRAQLDPPAADLAVEHEQGEVSEVQSARQQDPTFLEPKEDAAVPQETGSTLKKRGWMSSLMARHPRIACTLVIGVGAVAGALLSGGSGRRVRHHY